MYIFLIYIHTHTQHVIVTTLLLPEGEGGKDNPHTALDKVQCRGYFTNKG
jgi:hypothetical protein